jgi:hypothetical protein
MVILCFLAIWTFYFWLVQKCIRRSVAGIKVGDCNARQCRPRVQIPDTVPSEWVEAYRAENDA